MSERAKNLDVSERIRQARLSAPLTPDEIARRSPRQKGPLTQEELARRMGIDRVNLNKMENGGSVGEVNARRLAEALGGSPEDWLESQETRTGMLREIVELRARVEALEELLRLRSLPQAPPDEHA